MFCRLRRGRGRGTCGWLRQMSSSRRPNAGRGESPTPRLVSRAPLRISFAGGGTDLPEYSGRFGGLVVSVAIRRYATALFGRVSPADSAGRDCDAKAGGLALCRPEQERAMTDAVFARLGLGACPDELSLLTDVTPGSGLGVSSATMVTLVDVASRLAGARLSPAKVAQLAATIERDDLGWPGGLQDYYPAVWGGLNRIAFDGHKVEIHPLQLGHAKLGALQSSLLLCDVGRRRSAAAVTDQRARILARDPLTVAALHRQKVIAAEVEGCLRRGDMGELGLLLDDAWQQKRRAAPLSSCARIDAAYALALDAGAIGGKLCGAGGGGHLLILCPPNRTELVRRVLLQGGAPAVPVAFDRVGLSRS
jgi:D-glycero-alpha-D-manno-heptose-7-phosphate kinase